MRLDQFAFVYQAEIVGAVQTDLPIELGEKLHQWRNHPSLHGWMEQLYRTKGGRRNSLYGTTLRLDTEDLDALEKAVKGKALPETAGFFSGESDPEQTDSDMAFIAKARAAIARGLVLFYDAWW